MTTMLDSDFPLKIIFLNIFTYLLGNCLCHNNALKQWTSIEVSENIVLKYLKLYLTII